MDEKKPNNPDAFPVAGPAKIADGDKEMHLVQGGMTLLDYFAGQAMPAVLRLYSDESEADEFPARVALISYEIADAMLKAREDE